MTISYKNILLFGLGIIGSVLTQAFAQAPKWTELTLTNPAQYQAKGVTVKIFKETYSGLEGQQYTVKFTNISTQKLKIVGSLTARTYCGNALSITIDVAIIPGESLGGNDYLMDNVGLTGTVHTDDCKTDKIYPNPNDRNTYKYDRIRGLTLGSLMIMPLADPNAVVKNQAATTAVKPATNAVAGNNPAVSAAAINPDVKNAAPVGQNSQQAAYRQQANAYLNAAGTENNDIQKAMDLNLAKINATAGGNKLLVAQIQQQQNIQTEQQTQAVTDAATNLVSGLLDAKFNRDRERMQAQNDRFQKYTAEQADLAVKKQAPIAALQNLTRQDMINLSQTNSPVQIVRLVNNINRRFIRLDSIDKATAVSKIGMGAEGSLMVDIWPGAYSSYHDSIRANLSWMNDKHIDLTIINKEKNQKAIGAFYVNYYNGMAYYWGSTLRDSNMPADKAKALPYLKDAETAKPDTNEVRPTKYGLNHVFFNDHYEKVQGKNLPVGFIGLSQIRTSNVLGDIFVDSAKTSHQPALLNEAFAHYATSINYYFTYLHAYYLKNKAGRLRPDEEYPIMYQATFYKLLTTSYQIALAAANGTDAEKTYAYNCAEFCKKACQLYYGFLIPPAHK